MNSTPDRLHGQQVERKDPAHLAHPLVRDLAPGARRGAQIHDNHSWTDQLILVVDLHQFVGCTGTPALGLGTLDERIIDMLCHPGFAGLGTLHRGTIMPFCQWVLK